MRVKASLFGLISSGVHTEVPRQPPPTWWRSTCSVPPRGRENYVQARLSDGSFGLFMVDTGAGISAIGTSLQSAWESRARHRKKP